MAKKDSLLKKGGQARRAAVTAWMRRVNVEKAQHEANQVKPKQKSPKQLMKAKLKNHKKWRQTTKERGGEHLSPAAMEALREGNPLDQTVYTDDGKVIHKRLPGSYGDGKRE